ncbi:hypothetical protein B0T17DRAFT_519413 [Bombardia bombarda]|uniref:N-acetyltransferase domain-containing protein n=1 Tax=Bombardia bombarda TaxID=252184 RepID=A0AA39XP41_9PEZI|nr:hypothetical protein B0T17DRAFT_519413 [Bombardia bombarda]
MAAIMKPRQGLPSDLDAITNVIIKTMPLDPQWNYRFPYRKTHPHDHYKYTRMLFEYFLNPLCDDWLVMVTEDSLGPDSDETSVVSFGVWDVSYLNKRKYGPDYKTQDAVTLVEGRGGSTRKDANHERFNAFWKGQILAWKKNFGPNGPEQMHLQILATLPQYQRRGHASSLCKWAMRLVRRESLKYMSVHASPMGRALYSSLKFKTVATFDIQVPNEKEKLTLEAMMYKP